jgi:hypothetical protein
LGKKKKNESSSSNNATFIGGAAVVLLVGIVLFVNVKPSSDPPRVEAGVDLPTSAAPSSTPAASSASSTPITVPLAKLEKSDELRGKTICTCGLVHSTGTSPDRGYGGKERGVINNVFVSELAPPDASDDRLGARAICTWRGGAPPSVKQHEPVCVRGIYVGPVVKECSVVPACP